MDEVHRDGIILSSSEKFAQNGIDHTRSARSAEPFCKLDAFVDSSAVRNAVHEKYLVYTAAEYVQHSSVKLFNRTSAESSDNIVERYPALNNAVVERGAQSLVTIVELG